MTLDRRQLLILGGSAVVTVGVAAWLFGGGRLTGGFTAVPGAKAATPDLSTLLEPPALGDKILGKSDAPVTIVEYASATCPHCNFRPQEESLGTTGVAVLDQIDQQLDGLLASWTTTLIDNLDDPIAKKSIKLLPDAQKKEVEAFLKAKKLPEKVGNDLVQGMQQALSGLEAISVKPLRQTSSLGSRAPMAGITRRTTMLKGLPLAW